MKKPIGILIFLLIFNVGNAQQKIEFESKIKEKILNTYTGTLLVKTNKSLFGIDSKGQRISWENKDLKNVSFSDYSEIPFTPIIIFEKKPLLNAKVITNTLNSKGVSKTMLNVVTGKVLFDSEKQGLKAVNNTLLLPEQKAILVDGVKNKDLVISLFSYETGKQLWQTKALDYKFFKAVKSELFDEEKILLDAHQNIYWLKNKHLIKIEGKTGVIQSEHEHVTFIVMNPTKDVLFLFSDKIATEKLDKETMIRAFYTKTGNRVWKAPVKIWGNISNTVVDKDQMVVITSKGFNIIDIGSGKKKWERSDPLPLIKKIVPIDKGYLAVQDNYLVNIDYQGKEVWKKKVKITHSTDENPIHIIENPSQALYITPSQANKVEIEGGANVWKENVVLNTAGFLSRNLKLSEHYFQVWYDKEKKQFPVYSDNKFYIFNPESSVKPISLHDFNFKRTAPSLKIRDKGYLLFQNNEFYFFDTTGDLVYKKQYPFEIHKNFFSETFYWAKRGVSTSTAALGFVGNQVTSTLNSVLVSTDLGVLSTAASTIYGTYQSYQQSLDNLTDLNQLDIDSNMSAVFNRIKKGRKSDSSMLIVVPKEDESQVVELDIDSGKDKVIKGVSNTHSDFLIDQIERQIYFFGEKYIYVEKM